MTSGERAMARSELHVVHTIRDAVMGDSALSTNAHNVTIIAAGGIITLRGPADSSEEKASMGAKAWQVAGVRGVDNQMEVAVNCAGADPLCSAETGVGVADDPGSASDLDR